MPNAYINKLVKAGRGSKAELEKKWDDAKAAAAKQGHADDYGYITSIFKKMAHVAATNEELDKVCMDVPLFIRLLELARETLKSDVELHDVVERVLAVSTKKDTLTMEDYAAIWKDSGVEALSRLRIVSALELAADYADSVHDLALEIYGPKIRFNPHDGSGVFSGETCLWVVPDKGQLATTNKKFLTQVLKIPGVVDAGFDKDEGPTAIKVVFK